MGPWTIFGVALVTPIRRIDLVVRLFWPLLVWVIGGALAAYAGFLATGHDLVGFATSNVPFLIWMGFTLLFWMGTIPLTVIGLVEWHRHFVLDPEELAKPRGKGRALILFLQWFIVGLGLFACLILLTITVAPLMFLLMKMEKPPTPIQSQLPGWILSATSVNVAMNLVGSIIFSFIFKRRSLMLPFVATDADPAKPRHLIDFPIRHKAFGPLVALSIAIPYLASMVITIGIALYSQYGLTLGDVLQHPTPLPRRPDIWVTLANLPFALVQLLYPALVFATFVSIYYREHVRASTLEVLSSDREATAEGNRS